MGGRSFVRVRSQRFDHESRADGMARSTEWSPMTPKEDAAARLRARSRRNRWARHFRPEKVRLLLIAEAPPSALDRYFYFPTVPTQDSLFREVARAFLSMEPTRGNKRELLKGLQEEGVFLIDTVLEPVEGRYAIEIGRLIARVRRFR